MRLATAIVAMALPIGAQQVVSLPVGTPRPGASTFRSIPDDPRPQPSQANLQQLVELTGDRERLQKALPKLLSDGKTKMLRAYPGVDPAFRDEWEKRMAARIKVDDFLGVTARAYEKHFTNDEILDLIALMSARKEGKPVKASAQLQQKLEAEAPAIMGEIMGGATEVAVKLGAQVGGEIAKEHPEYMRQKPQPRVVPN
jgi:hypothetical protein